MNIIIVGCDRVGSSLAEQLKCIEADACIHITPYGAITVGEKGEMLSDMDGMAPDVVGFSDDGRGVQSEEMMREAMKRAKALGDYLIVAISTDEFNWNSKQKKCYFTYEQRKALVEAVRYVDLVIPEESWEQKKNDMHEYHIDTFVIGDDWKGKFDFLKEEGVEVVYLPRTPEISTTQIKKDLNK